MIGSRPEPLSLPADALPEATTTRSSRSGNKRMRLKVWGCNDGEILVGGFDIGQDSIEWDERGSLVNRLSLPIVGNLMREKSLIQPPTSAPTANDMGTGG